MPQINQTVQEDEETVLEEGPKESLQHISLSDLSTVINVFNKSGVDIYDDGMRENLASMVFRPKAQQKIRTSNGEKMHEAFFEAKVLNSVVGIYERNRIGNYNRICSGAIINYFHVITGKSFIVYAKMIESVFLLM